MPHFVIVCPEDAGHLLSLGPIGNALVCRGHRVTILARAQAASIAERLNLPLHPLNTDGIPRPRFLPLWLAFALFGSGWKIVMRNSFRWRAEAILQRVPQALTELAADGLILDHTIGAGGTAAERVGIPFVTICSALLWHEEVGVPPAFTAWAYAEGRRARLRNRLGYAGWHWFMRPVLKAINRHRIAWNLRPLRRIDDGFSPLAQISQLCREFDFPRRELPPHFHYVGSLAARRTTSVGPDFPWDRLDGRPLIFASLGTVPDPTNLPVFRKIAEACAGLNAQLVMTLGRWTDQHASVRERLGPLPGDPILVDFAPQLALLDKAALLITHAGVNTVLEALERSVPMVALPRSVDQLGMGSRIEHAGVGLCTSFHRCRPEVLRGLIERVLTDDAFRQRGRRLQQAMIAAGGAERAAEIAEEALTTRQPVLRSHGMGSAR